MLTTQSLIGLAPMTKLKPRQQTQSPHSLKIVELDCGAQERNGNCEEKIIHDLQILNNVLFPEGRYGRQITVARREHPMVRYEGMHSFMNLTTSVLSTLQALDVLLVVFLRPGMRCLHALFHSGLVPGNEPDFKVTRNCH